MAFPVTLNGRTYTLADFAGQNYVDGMPDAFEDFVTQAGNTYATTSTSTVSFAAGAATFTVAETGKPYQEGTPLRISVQGTPTDYLNAVVTSYSGTTLNVTVVSFNGSGSASAWNINIGGDLSIDGTSPPVPISLGGTGATTQADAQTALFPGIDDNAAATLMTLNSDATVDIGTSTPTSITISGWAESSDIDFLLPGSSAGPLIQGGFQSHLVLATQDNDPNDGVYIISGGGDYVTDTTYDTLVAAFKADGNVGIGTDSPSAALDVESEIHVNDPASTNPLRLRQTGSDAEVVNVAAGDIELGLANDGDIHLVNGVAKNKRLTVAVNGNVGIGEDDPVTRLHMATTGTDFCSLRMDAGNTINASYSLRSHDGVFDVRDNNASATRMTIDANGNLLVGKTAAGFAVAGCRIQPTGDVRISKTGAASDTMIAFYKNGSATAVGTITSTDTATSYNTSSDERLKENITDAPAGNIDSIKVRSFDWKADGSHQEYGFIAQELDEVVPYAVSKGETEEDTWGVDYSKLVPMLVKEIQDLRARVATLEAGA